MFFVNGFFLLEALQVEGLNLTEGFVNNPALHVLAIQFARALSAPKEIVQKNQNKRYIHLLLHPNSSSAGVSSQRLHALQRRWRVCSKSLKGCKQMTCGLAPFEHNSGGYKYHPRVPPYFVSSCYLSRRNMQRYCMVWHKRYISLIPSNMCNTDAVINLYATEL